MPIKNNILLEHRGIWVSLITNNLGILRLPIAVHCIKKLFVKLRNRVHDNPDVAEVHVEVVVAQPLRSALCSDGAVTCAIWRLLELKKDVIYEMSSWSFPSQPQILLVTRAFLQFVFSPC